MRPLSLFAAAALCLGSLPAQTQTIAWFKDNDPVTGSGNAFPFGSNGVRYQAIVPASLLGSRPQRINDIFVAGRTKDLEVVYDDVEIRMGMTAQATPVASWAANNPSPTVVYRGPMRIRFKVRRWVGIGLPRAFFYLPRGRAVNLCFEVIVWKTRHSGSNFYFPLAGTSSSPGGAIPRAFRFRWTTNQSLGPIASRFAGMKMGLLLGDGNFVTVGTGCRSSRSTTLEIGADTFPRRSKPIRVTLAGARSVAPAVLMLGTSFTKFLTLPLPFDLAPLGAPGCFVWNDLAVVLPAGVTDTQGKAKLPLVVLPGLGNARLYMHWWVFDRQANRFGWTTSSLGEMLLGN